MQSNQITVQALQTKLKNQESLYLLDVRQPHEWNAFHLSEHLIPLAELPQRMNEIPRDIPIVVYCHSGVRSQMAVELLKAAGYMDVKNLIGGIVAWQTQLS